MMQDKPLPNNENVEIRFVSTLLTDQCKKMIPDYLNRIKPEHFYTLKARNAYELLLKMYSQGEEISLITFDNCMQREISNELTKYGITEVITSGLVTVNPAPDAKEILHYYNRRKLIIEAQRIQNIAFDTALDYNEFVPKIKEITDSLDIVSHQKSWNIQDLSPTRFFQSEPPEIQWIIDKVLAKGIVGFIYGEGGSYKSLAALWLVYQRACAKIHSRQLWLDKFPVTPGRSIFFSAEDVETDLQIRTLPITACINAGRPDIPEDKIVNAIINNSRVMSREQWIEDRELFIIDENGRETPKVDKIIELAKEFDVDLIVIETFSRVFNVDECDNKQAARAVAALERIRDRTGATVLCIAHSSKAARSAQNDSHGQNGLRGASALMDNARFGIWFKSQKPESGIRTIQIVNSKNFRCNLFDTFSVTAQFPEFKIAENQFPLEDDLVDKITTYIKDHPGTTQTNALHDIAGCRYEVKNAAFRQLVNDGVIEQRTVDQKKGYYVVQDD